jgi:hypothetical protein
MRMPALARFLPSAPAVPARVTPAAGAALRRGAWAVAAGRLALGVAAVAQPAVPARPWVGEAAGGVAARVFGRALGARDISLGAGALAALRREAADPGPACAWVAAGAVADALDVAATVASWRELPPTGRWLVALTAGGAALTGAAAAATLWPGRAGPVTRRRE